MPTLHAVQKNKCVRMRVRVCLCVRVCRERREKAIEAKMLRLYDSDGCIFSPISGRLLQIRSLKRKRERENWQMSCRVLFPRVLLLGWFGPCLCPNSFPLLQIPPRLIHSFNVVPSLNGIYIWELLVIQIRRGPSSKCAYASSFTECPMPGVAVKHFFYLV